jgi:thymidylate synthase (FAD)
MSVDAIQQQEIDASRRETTPTRRATVPALEEVLFTAFPVLDHGFIRVVDYMGDDQAIVQAARVSYGKGTKKLREDAGLIRYLMRHHHSTPFEMCEIKLHVKLPMFVARQWIRHRTANVNEYSARYSVMDKEFYIPSPEHLAAQSRHNRQGRGETLTGQEAARALDILKEDAVQCYTHYEELLNETREGEIVDNQRQGLARELARMNLPVNFYTQWYWKTDLHNLMHFIRLRADSHAQYEIRAYAEAMADILKRWVPLTYEAFVDYRQESVTLSREAMAVVRRMIAGEQITREQTGLSAREWEELEQSLNLPLTKAA